MKKKLGKYLLGALLLASLVFQNGCDLILDGLISLDELGNLENSSSSSSYKSNDTKETSTNSSYQNKETVIKQDATSTQGKLKLVEISKFQPNELKINTLVNTNSIDAKGNFDFSTFKENKKEELIIISDKNDNPILLGYYKNGDNLIITPESTAISLVLMCFKSMNLPSQNISNIREKIQNHKDLPKLIELINQNLENKESIIGGENEEEIFNFVSSIGKTILDEINPDKIFFSDLDEFSVKSEKPLKIGVDDDKNHSTPEVIMFNKTSAWYTVNVTKDGKSYTKDGGEYLEKKSIISDLNEITNIQTVADWTDTRKSIFPGDGELQFTFKMEQDATIADATFDAIGGIMGIPASFDLNKQRRIIMAGGGALAPMAKDFIAIVEKYRRSTDWTIKDLSSDVAVFLTTNGYSVLSAGADIAKASIEEAKGVGLAASIAKFTTSKFFIKALIAYYSYNFIRSAYSMIKEPVSYQTGGLQKNGRYPVQSFAITPPKIETNTCTNVELNIDIDDKALPKDKETKFMWDFYQTSKVSFKVDSGKEKSIKTSFSEAGPYSITVDLVEKDNPEKVLFSSDKAYASIEPCQLPLNLTKKSIGDNSFEFQVDNGEKSLFNRKVYKWDIAGEILETEEPTVTHTWAKDVEGTFEVKVIAIDKSDRMYYTGKVIGSSSISVFVSNRQILDSCYLPGDDMSLPPACE